jgi:SMC interacting uncharacterized protein involved in chromosome segregation
MNKLPKELQRVYIMADKCCKVLMMRGMNAKAAEETVLNTLKEYDSDLRTGNYKKIETALEIKFA